LAVLTILGLGRFVCVLCFLKVKLSVKVKLFVVVMCVCNFACKGRPRKDLHCVGRDVKPYSLTVSLQSQGKCLWCLVLSLSIWASQMTKELQFLSPTTRTFPWQTN